MATMDPVKKQKLTRLNDLEELLSIIYEKRHEFEKERQITTSAAQKFELKQRIKKDILPDLKRYESEQARLLADIANIEHLVETEADPLVGELLQAATKIQQQHDSLPGDIQQKLQDIQEMLQAPGKSAAAKLKISLPIIPLLASYELELDTESFFTQAWDKIKTLFQKAVVENP